MKVSTKGRYALRLMADLARTGEKGPVSLKEIAERQGVSVKYLEQIASLLCKARLLSGTRGPQGGYRLTRKPEEYPVGEILRLTEGNLFPVPCLGNQPNQCPRHEACSTVGFWGEFYRAMAGFLDSKTLCDLL